MRNLLVMHIFVFTIVLLTAMGSAHAAVTASITPPKVIVDNGDPLNVLYTVNVNAPTPTTGTNNYFEYGFSVHPSTGGDCFYSSTSYTTATSFQANVNTSRSIPFYVSVGSPCTFSSNVQFSMTPGTYTIGYTVDYYLSCTGTPGSTGTACASTGSVSGSTTLTINPSITPTLTITPNTIDQGTINSNAVISWPPGQGTPPYNALLLTSGTSPSCSGSSSISNSSLSINPAGGYFTSNGVTLLIPNAKTLSSGTYYYCAVINDSSFTSSASLGKTNFKPVLTSSSELIVNPDPSIGIPTVSPTTVDLTGTNSNGIPIGQQVTINAIINGGTPPYSNPSLTEFRSTSQIYHNTGTCKILSGDKIECNETIYGAGAGSYEFGVSAVDSENTIATSPLSSTITVNPQLTAFTTSPSANSIEQGQPFNVILSWTGGTPPYNAIVYVYNATSNTAVSGLQAFTLNGISSTSANVPIQSSKLKPGTYYLKATISDSSGAGPETNSSTSGNFVITPGPEIIEILSSNSLTYPNYPTVSVEVANGTLPYSGTISIVNQASGNVVESNTISLASSNSIFTYSTNVLLPGSYFANVIITDSASPSVTVYSSNIFTINKNKPILSLNVPPSFVYNTQSPTVTASVYPLGLTGNLVMSINSKTPLIVGSFSSTSNVISYNAPADADNYSFTILTNANAIYDSGSITANYMITKLPLRVSASKLPSNTVYNGTNYTITVYNYNLTLMGTSVSLNGNTIIVPKVYTSNGISTIPFYTGAVSSNGTAYFTTDSNTIYYYPEGSTFGNEIIYLPSGFKSYGIAISNITDYAYATSYRTNDITIINLKTNSVIGNITLPSGSEATYDIISKNNSILYVSNLNITQNDIYAINLLTKAITTINGFQPYFGPNYLTLSPSGKHIYVSGFENVSVVNTTTDAVQYNINSLGQGVLQTSVSSNGTYLYIPLYAATQSVLVFNTRTRSVVRQIDVYFPSATAVSEGNAYLFSEYPYDTQGPSFGYSIVNTTLNTKLYSANTTYPSRTEFTVPFYFAPKYAFTGKNGTIYLVGPYGYSNHKGNYTIVSITPVSAPTLQYSLPAAAGTYELNFTIFNSNYTGIGVYNETYTISKATPVLHMSRIKHAFVYTGNSINANVTVSISNTLQKLSGTLYLNGNAIGTYSPNSIGANETFTINAVNIGSYKIEFSTAGNANYTSASTSQNFTISAAIANVSLSVPKSFVYNGANAIITASIYPSNVIGNLYMSIDGGNYINVASTSTSSNTITFDAPAASGNYSFEFYNNGNTLYGEGFAIANYSIYKAIPNLSFTKMCSSYVVDGLSCNTIASIDTYNSQITANLYLNGKLVGSTYNSITSAGSNTIGLYTYVFNETGDKNYSADSITYAYEIRAHGSGHATTTSTSTTTTTMPYTVNSTTTSISTTTVPQHTLNISSSTTSYTGSFRTSAGKPYNVSFGNLDVFVSFATSSPNTTNVSFTIANYTRHLPFFANHAFVKAFILNFTSASHITANITITYDCASGYQVVPYEFVNGSLQPITPYTTNLITCTISFSVSSDPIVALYENTTAPTSPATTIAPTTSLPSTTIPQQPPSKSPNYGYVALAAIIVVVVGIVAYVMFANKHSKRRRGP